MEGKVHNNKKPIHITISTVDTESPCGLTDNEAHKMKRFNSAKNVQQMKPQFDFDQNNVAAILNTRSQKRLEKNNQILHRSLLALKTGAVQAIAEKQQEIEHLKHHTIIEEEIRIREEEMEELNQERNQLKAVIQNLEDRIMTDRQGYERLLEEKERIIEELYSELGSTQLQIENLQKYELIKQKKIKIIEEENFTLFHQLQEEKISHLGVVSTLIDSDEAHRPISDIVIDESDESYHSKEGGIYSENPYHLRQIEQKHKNELHELSIFYEKRMEEIRELYEREFHLMQTVEKLNDYGRDEQPLSFKETTQVAPKKLSYELTNFPKLSQCYSITRRNLSKADSLSVFTLEKENLESDSKVGWKMKKLNYASNNQSSKRQASDQSAVVIENPLSRRSSIFKQSHKMQFSLSSFLIGAVTAGTLTTALCKLF